MSTVLQFLCLVLSSTLTNLSIAIAHAHLTGSSYLQHGNNSIVTQATRSVDMMNPIDACWRSDPNWTTKRIQLANCAIGFGKDAMGGKHGNMYVVTTEKDDPLNPQPGMLRYGVIRSEPLWIIFQRDMTITLEHELMVNSHKTIDGRGAEVHIAYGACMTLHHVSHVIVHGLHFHDCKVTSGGYVRTSPHNVAHRGGADGDAIRVFESTRVWIDHNTFSNCHDGLVDIIHASTSITISNNHFFNHDKVMLLGHSDDFHRDRIMAVTIAYNRFGPDCIQRMPRCRFGYCHVVNNNYIGWGISAIGGSADSTILSEGNRYLAPQDPRRKQVTKRETPGGNWKSVGDIFLNGAYFIESGKNIRPSYGPHQGFETEPAKRVPSMSSNAGALRCFKNKSC